MHASYSLFSDNIFCTRHWQRHFHFYDFFLFCCKHFTVCRIDVLCVLHMYLPQLLQHAMHFVCVAFPSGAHHESRAVQIPRSSRGHSSHAKLSFARGSAHFAVEVVLRRYFAGRSESQHDGKLGDVVRWPGVLLCKAMVSVKFGLKTRVGFVSYPYWSAQIASPLALHI